MKMLLRRAIGVLLMVVMVVGLMPVLPGFTLGVSAAELALSGEGTELSPYLIYNNDDLIRFRDYVNSGNDCANQYFKMTDSIDTGSRGGHSYDVIPNKEYTPIGKPDAPFKGHFDGAGHAVLNICVQKNMFYVKNSNEASYYGLFGYIGEGGSVKNVSVTGYIQALYYVGGIAGYSDGVIENCTNFCHIVVANGQGDLHSIFEYGYGPTGYIGGIVGSSGADIINCANFGMVDGHTWVQPSKRKDHYGGIAGESRGGDIVGCYNTGTVSNLEYAHTTPLPWTGGITGEKKNGNIIDCYNCGEVYGKIDGAAAAAGIASYYDQNSRVKNCYNVGPIYYYDQYNGKLHKATNSAIGNSAYKSEDTMINCYYLNEDAQESGATSLAKEEFGRQWVTDSLNQSSDFAWVISPYLGRPVLVDNPECFYGSGTEGDPYVIKNAKSLAYFRDYVNNGNDFSGKYVRLDADIDMSVYVIGYNMVNIDPPKLTQGSNNYYGSAQNYLTTPIGNSKTPFNGHFDGNCHKITGITKFVAGTEGENQGLFGYIGSEGTVERLIVAGAIEGNIPFKGATGAIVGTCMGKIMNCYTDVYYYGSSYVATGGIAGILGKGGEITNCCSIGRAQNPGNGPIEPATEGSGGLVYKMEAGSKLSNSYYYNPTIGSDAFAFLYGDEFGFITDIKDDSAVIENCYWLDPPDPPNRSYQLRRLRFQGSNRNDHRRRLQNSGGEAEQRRQRAGRRRMGGLSRFEKADTLRKSRNSFTGRRHRGRSVFNNEPFLV